VKFNFKPDHRHALQSKKLCVKYLPEGKNEEISLILLNVFVLQKEKTTYEQLECLEDKIKDIEQYSWSTQERKRKLVSYFLFISIGLYIIAAVIFCLFFFPPNLKDRIIYSALFLIVPLFW
jgi:hypothetical protein